MLRSLVGSEMCIRDRYQRRVRGVGIYNVMSKQAPVDRVLAAPLIPTARALYKQYLEVLSLCSAATMTGVMAAPSVTLCQPRRRRSSHPGPNYRSPLCFFPTSVPHNVS
eukprot:TRINITY_DN56690_c0_g1_i2.p1 TRINITY_DN56690_c0_g1~~TRINITY_DN56690_c0_g1_i2.p1  ORF type:complete len:109 (+),score=16.87 TRINITY_DN56690_c0_g1_i2:125-451(+)